MEQYFVNDFDRTARKNRIRRSFVLAMHKNNYFKDPLYLKAFNSNENFKKAWNFTIKTAVGFFS